MQCSCGSSKSKSLNSKKSVNGAVYSLSYLQCENCTRVGSEVLYINSVYDSGGLAARQKFNVLDTDLTSSEVEEQIPSEAELETEMEPVLVTIPVEPVLQPEIEEPAQSLELVKPEQPPVVQDIPIPGTDAAPDSKRALMNENHRKLITVTIKSNGYQPPRVLKWVVIDHLYVDGRECFVPYLGKRFTSTDLLGAMTDACEAITAASLELTGTDRPLKVSQTDAPPQAPALSLDGKDMTVAVTATEQPTPEIVTPTAIEPVAVMTAPAMTTTAADDEGQLALF